MKRIKVFCLDDGSTAVFLAKSAYDALEKMRYTLDLQNKDDGAEIKETTSGRCLWFRHSGKIYSATM